MGDTDRQRWDTRYASGEYRPRSEPSPLVEEAIRYIGSGDALVLACGTGRNALALAGAGFEVTAMDVSPVAIEMARDAAADRGIDVDWQVADLDEVDLPHGRYDLITMIRYTNRGIWPRLVAALRPDGWLLLEQHLKTHREVAGPGEDFRVSPGELLGAFPDLRVIVYFEAFEASDRTEGMMTATAGLLACKGDPGW